MTLYEELTTGILAEQIAPYIISGNDGEINRLLTEQNISVNGSVSVNTFAIWCAETGMRAVITDQAVNPASPLRSIALTLLDLLQGNLTPASLDLSIAQNVDMLHVWVTAGLLTTAQEQELILLSKKLISRAEQLGIDCSITEIAKSLRG
jgi:hypothetical protein